MPAWDDLRVFLALFDARRVTRAAERLKLSPSTVSRRLSALEAQLGAPLFVRTPEGITPTPTAEAIIGEVRALEEAALRIPRLVSALGDKPQGLVRVSAAPLVGAYVVLPVLAELSRAHPELELDLVSTTDLSDLVRFEVDIAIRGARPESGEALVAKRVSHVATGLFASERYLAERPPPGEAGHARIGWPTGSTFPEARWLDAHLPHLPVAVRTNDMRLHVDAACLGLGIALLPAVLARTHAALRPVEWPGVEPPTAPLYLVGHRATRHGARVAPVWELLERTLTEAPDEAGTRTLRERLEPTRR